MLAFGSVSKTVYSGLRGLEVGDATREEKRMVVRGGTRDRNRVRDLGAKEADEEADAPQLVSRIMVILKAPERRECPACPLKAISPRRE